MIFKSNLIKSQRDNNLKVLTLFVIQMSTTFAQANEKLEFLKIWIYLLRILSLIEKIMLKMTKIT